MYFVFICKSGIPSVAEIIFYLTPISVTLILNIYFFCSTSRRCNKIKKDLEKIKHKASELEGQKLYSAKSRQVS